MGNANNNVSWIFGSMSLAI